MKGLFARVSVHRLVVLLALYFVVAFNWPVLQRVVADMNAVAGVSWLFVANFTLSLFLLLQVFLLCVAWPYVFKPVMTLLIVVSSLVCYAGFRYGAIINQSMIDNVLLTNQGEAASYWSWSLLLWVVLTVLLPVAWLWRVRIVYGRWHQLLSRRVLLLVVSTAGAAMLISSQYNYYASIGRNDQALQKMIVPSQWVYSSVKYVRQKYFTMPLSFRTVGRDVQVSAHDAPRVMVLVLGETARAQNAPFNGYARDTMPYTARLPFIKMPMMRSCGTSTAESVPCIFSDMKHANYDRAQALNSDNVLDILRRADIDVLWLENDGGCQGVCGHAQLISYPRDEEDGDCQGAFCLDQVFIRDLPEYLARIRRDTLIVVHITGSHGPSYHERYPREFAVFQPDCQRNDIEHCSPQSLINTYDNTILYTDYVVASLTDELAKGDFRDSALWYFSDHGESLGENNLYLHGFPYRLAPDEQTHVPAMLWLSPTLRAQAESCMSNGLADTSHDNVFASLLGFFALQTAVYVQADDVLVRCGVTVE